MIDVGMVQTYIDEINAGERLDLPAIEGYSSAKVRNLLNRLANGASHYLEIGVHLGSTFIPAIYGNRTPATCIDNWSRFGPLRDKFEASLEEYGLLTKRVQIIEQDCFTVNLETIRKSIEIINSGKGHPGDSEIYAAYVLTHHPEHYEIRKLKQSVNGRYGTGEYSEREIIRQRAENRKMDCQTFSLHSWSETWN